MHEIFVVGDLNINLLSSDRSNLTNFFSSYNIYPTIYYPTRVCQNSATLIDNIFTNINSHWSSGVVDSTFSDHYLIFNCAYAQLINHTKNTPKQYTYICQNALIEHMAKHNWDFITDSSDVNDDCEKLMHKLMESVDQAKCTKISNNSYKTPWMTSAILQSCLHKHNLFKQFQSGLIAKTEYTMYRNRLTNLFANAKSNIIQKFVRKIKKILKLFGYI